MASMHDLPIELQSQIWFDFIRDTGVWKERIPRIAALRLVCKRFSTQLLCNLCTSTFMAEMDRRAAKRAARTDPHMEIAIQSQIGQDAVTKTVYMAMVQGTDGVSAWVGLKILTKFYDKEEDYHNAVAGALERGEPFQLPTP